MEWEEQLSEEEKTILKEAEDTQEEPKKEEEKPSEEAPEEVVSEETEGVDEVEDIPEGQESKYGI